MSKSGKKSNRFNEVYWEIDTKFNIWRGSSKVWIIFEISQWE